MDGWQFLQARKTKEDWARIPVIAVSAVAYRGAPSAAVVLPKPLEMSRLLTAIQQVFARGVESLRSLGSAAARSRG